MLTISEHLRITLQPHRPEIRFVTFEKSSLGIGRLRSKSAVEIIDGRLLGISVDVTSVRHNLSPEFHKISQLTRS